ncbi:MAG: hypothetical protein Q8M91_05845 [Polaromonas sp.]|nr:hypothetical protein [Polaromonas sp.]
MDFLITLLIGLIAFGIVLFAFFRSLRQGERIDLFIRTHLKMPWLADQLWWFLPVLFLFVAINLIQTIVTLIDPSISF